VISEILDGRPLEIGSRRLSSTDVICIQIERHASVPAESRLEADTALDRPPAGRNLR
jgi:hypothetical protein